MKCTAENREAGKLGGSFCRFFEDSGQDVTKRRTTGKKRATKGIHEPHEKLCRPPSATPGSRRAISDSELRPQVRALQTDFG